MYLIMFESYFFLLAAKGSAKIVKRFPKVPIIALRIHNIPMENIRYCNMSNNVTDIILITMILEFINSTRIV